MNRKLQKYIKKSVNLTKAHSVLLAILVLLGLLVGALFLHFSILKQPYVKYTSPTLGYGFEYPESWSVDIQPEYLTDDAEEIFTDENYEYGYIYPINSKIKIFFEAEEYTERNILEEMKTLHQSEQIDAVNLSGVIVITNSSEYRLASVVFKQNNMYYSFLYTVDTSYSSLEKSPHYNEFINMVKTFEIKD